MATDELRATARMGSRADRQVDKFFQRAPFLYALLLALLTLSATGGVWTATIQARVKSLEEFKWNIEHDSHDGTVGIVEQTHLNNTTINRNRQQLRTINKTLYNVPDPSE